VHCPVVVSKGDDCGEMPGRVTWSGVTRCGPQGCNSTEGQQQVQHVSVVTRPTRGVRRTAMDHNAMCPSDTCLAFQLPASARGPSIVYLSQSSRVVTCKWVALMPSPSAHLAWVCVQSIGAIGHTKASIPTLYCYQLLACVDNTSPASRNVA
jgi:hypothetical protein